MKWDIFKKVQKDLKKMSDDILIYKLRNSIFVDGQIKDMYINEMCKECSDKMDNYLEGGENE